jgi:hypothetical protein
MESRILGHLDGVGARVETPGAEEAGAEHELRATALTALGLALLALAGIASSVSPWHATGAASAQPGALRALAAVGGAVLVVALLALWVETPAAWRPKRKDRRLPAAEDVDDAGGAAWSAGKTAAIVMLAFAVFCIATLPLLIHDGTSSQAPPTPDVPTGGAQAPAGRGSPPASVDLGWLLVPIAVTAGVLTPAALVIRRRRSRRDRAAHPDDASTLGRAVRASIAALESERDPRRAILRAYERMEQAFETVEIVRGRDETASEFLGRATRRLALSGDAAATLTERFEEVRYSTHEITEADREDALASLRRVERELAERP